MIVIGEQITLPRDNKLTRRHLKKTAVPVPQTGLGFWLRTSVRIKPNDVA